MLSTKNKLLNSFFKRLYEIRSNEIKGEIYKMLLDRENKSLTYSTMIDVLQANDDRRELLIIKHRLMCVK